MEQSATNRTMRIYFLFIITFHMKQSGKNAQTSDEVK
jgi:hypothetical protein